MSAIGTKRTIAALQQFVRYLGVAVDDKRTMADICSPAGYRFA